MTTSNPIAGNNGFTKVDNLVGQLTKLNASDGTFASLSAGVASVGGFAMTGGVTRLNGQTLYSVKGTAPTLAASTSYFVNKQSGAAAQTPASDNDVVLTLPAGALVVGVVLEDATIDATVAAGTQALTGVVAAANVDLAAATPLADVNAGAFAGLTATPSLAAAAASVTTGAVAVAAAPTVTGVTVTTGAGLTASSGLTVTVFYFA